MTDILCSWLNNEVQVSTFLDATNFTRELSNGYIIGEVLAKYQLQDDFDQFSQNRTADSKLNNFTRLEPVLHLLQQSFDTNIARDIMTEKPGVATRLMYGLYIALNNKTKNNLTGTAMETMRAPAPVKLEGVESVMYKERLKHLTPRQTDLNLDRLASRFHEKQLKLEATAFDERFREQERYEQAIQQNREELRRKYRENKAHTSEILAKIQAATVRIPKPPPNRTAQAIAERQKERKNQEAKELLRDIDLFEDRMRRTLPPSKHLGDTESAESQPKVTLELIKPASNDEYLGKIKRRLEEDASARAEREKRRRKVLVDQQKAHEAQEEARREEVLVQRLVRQSQQERRLAVQLLQVRQEKEVLRHNRLLRQEQYQQRRLQELQESMDKEAEMARLARLEYEEQTKKDKALHDKIVAEKAGARYKKHYEMSGAIVDSMVDFVTKIGEYRELTNKLLPQKLMREWKLLFVEGKPLYETEVDKAAETEEPTPEEILEQERQQLLDEGDFNEYRNMVGEWCPPDGSEISGPPRNNPILGHIVQRLFNIVHPPTPPPPPPEFPPFPIKASILGKVFSGKSTCCKKLAETHRLQILSVESLLDEAVQAYKDGEVTEEQDEDELGEEKARTADNTADPTPISQPVTATPGSQPPGSQQQQTEVMASQASGRKTDSTQPHDSALDNKEQEEASRQGEEDKDDGTEKTDPEKPVDEDISTSATVKSQASIGSKASSPTKSRSTLSKSAAKSKATPRAKLGAKASKFLKKGQPVEDKLLVEILVEAIRRIPEESGWILDGFPSTYAQAKLLEKALSGFEGPASREASQTNLAKEAAGKSKGKKSQLAPDPRPAPPPPEPKSGINVVIRFDIQDELCLKRSAGRTYAVQADTEYHEEFNSPPEGSATGVGKQERVIAVEDSAHDQEQVQHRLSSFQDNWGKLEKWFTKFGTLKTVDASLEMESLYLEVENILEETLRKLQAPEEEPQEVLEVAPEEEKKPEPEKPPEPEPQPEPPKEEPSRSRPSSRKSSGRAGSRSRSGSKSADKKEKGKKSPSRADSKVDTKKSSRGSSPKSPKGKRGKSGKGKKTPEPEPEPEPEQPPGTPPPEPGSEQWEFVDQPLEQDLAGFLSSHWEVVEENYIKSCKNVFHNIRDENENIIRYYYQIREDYLSYLRRPDHKQEFVDQWQMDFNEVSDDIRDDEETRAELHQRIDDLRERVWNICDERKEQAERERESVISDGWLEDHLGLLSNHYITIMQVEVDRFQDSIRMMKDYYRGMEGKIPDEQQGEYIRIPLIELPECERPPSAQPSEAGQDGDGEAPATQGSADEVKSLPSKTGTPAGKKKKEETTAEAAADAEEKRRIPLVPRRPPSPDAAGGKGKPDKSKGSKGKDGVEDSPPPPEDPDERLLFDAHLNGLTAVDKMVAAEQAAKEAEEEAERERERERELERQKQAAATNKKGKGKGGKKSRSPSPKKGKSDKDVAPPPVTPPPEEEMSEEEKEMKRQKLRAREEYLFSVKEEAARAKTRLDLVKALAVIVLHSLKNQADFTYKDMNDWLGARFLKEMESIDQMSEVMRNAVENGTKLKEELMICQEDFLINKGVKVLRTPSPEPRPPPLEQAAPNSFTVDQLLHLLHQFLLTSPTGLLSLKAFQDTFQDLSSLTHGTEQIPDMWLNLTQEKLELLSSHMSSDGEYVDWRAFLLSAAHPWPTPTQSQLLDTLARCRELDQKLTGYITREQYDSMALWFSSEELPPTPDDPQEPPAYDRLGNLKNAFFDIFADYEKDPPQLDYVSMLMYFSVDSDPCEGFLRALSVSANMHMPRLNRPLDDIRKTSRSPSQASLAVSVEMEGEKQILKEDESKVVPDDIPESAIEATVSLDALVKTLHHGKSMRGDSHRFSVSADPEDAYSKERLAGVYQELGSEDLDPVPFTVLLEHPIIQDLVITCNTFHAVDLRLILAHTIPDNVDTQSLRTNE